MNEENEIQAFNSFMAILVACNKAGINIPPFPYKVPPPPVFSGSSLLFCPFSSPVIRTWITRNVSLQELPQDFTTRPLLYGTVEIHKVMLPMGYG